MILLVTNENEMIDNDNEIIINVIIINNERHY